MCVVAAAKKARAMRFDCNHTLTLFTGIEDLREKREAINREILKDEEEKAKIQKVLVLAARASLLDLPFLPLQELSRLTERLSRINEDLQRKMAARNEFDQTIQETEAAYYKVRLYCRPHCPRCKAHPTPMTIALCRFLKAARHFCKC